MELRSGLWSDGGQIKMCPDLECLLHDMGCSTADPLFVNFQQGGERQEFVTGSCASYPRINDSQGWLTVIFNLIVFKIYC